MKTKDEVYEEYIQIYAVLCRIKLFRQFLRSKVPSTLYDFNKELGLCHNLIIRNYDKRNIIVGIIDSIFESWDEYSGDVNYPVKHNKYKPDTAYFSLNIAMYGKGHYGQARLRLLDYLEVSLTDKLKELHKDIIGWNLLGVCINNYLNSGELNLAYTHIRKVQRELNRIPLDKPIESNGLCNKTCLDTIQVSPLFNVINALKYKYYSGSTMFPIEHPDEHNPNVAFIVAKRQGTLYTGEYGNRRRHLLDVWEAEVIRILGLIKSN